MIAAFKRLSKAPFNFPPSLTNFELFSNLVVNLQDVIGSGKSLPNFGPYAKEKKEKIFEIKQNLDILGENKLPENRPATKPTKPIPSVQEVIGRALDKIGTYSDLDNRYRGLPLL